MEKDIAPLHPDFMDLLLDLEHIRTTKEICEGCNQISKFLDRLCYILGMRDLRAIKHYKKNGELEWTGEAFS